MTARSVTEAASHTARDLVCGDDRNRLKLAVFAINGNWARASAPERFTLSWANSLEVAVLADDIGFEMIVGAVAYGAVAGGPRNRSAHSFENFTWAAAIAARTRHSAILSTVPIQSVHPLMAAKAMATIDHVSGGRFGLNIVTGWSKAEFDLFNTAGLSQAERYPYGDEWITLIKRLWTEDDYVDFDGRYFTLHNAVCQPKPIQKPYPLLMNAGLSAEGRDFATRHCDIAFLTGNERDYLRANVDAYRKEARERHGREIQVWGLGHVVQGDTPEQAAEMFRRYGEAPDPPISEEQRSTAMKPMIDRLGRPLNAEEIQLINSRMVLGNGAILAGDARMIADELAFFSDCGFDGMMLTWVDYRDGLRRFGQEVSPLLQQLGLRRPHPHPAGR